MPRVKREEKDDGVDRRKGLNKIQKQYPDLFDAKLKEKSQSKERPLSVKQSSLFFLFLYNLINF